MANITFYLGAGASAESLPTYKNFHSRFREFVNFFDSKNSFKNLDESKKWDRGFIHKQGLEILEEFQFHNTPDTIAKKYFHTFKDSEKVNQLKKIVILFFLYEQILSPDNLLEDGKRQSIDKRYDAFIASLLRPIRGKFSFHNQFKILTWNYDLQFELTFAKYLSQNVSYAQRFIQSFPRIDIEGNEKLDLNELSIIHLNGLAYARTDVNRGNSDLLTSFHKQSEYFLEYLIDVYASMSINKPQREIGGVKLLSFAWENRDDDLGVTLTELYRNAISVAQKTEVLVVIGYSFPIFNNEIDKMLFEHMRSLKKIYIQAPNAAEIERIIVGDLLLKSNLRNVQVIDVGYWNQFYIPPEWNIPMPKKSIIVGQ